MRQELGKETTCGIDEKSGRYFETVRYFYGCGHCSHSVIVKGTNDMTFTRPRCNRCSRFLCDKPICNMDCTPLYSLANDKFENAGEWGKLVPAIMKGATSIKDAEEKGIILTDR